MLELVEMLTVSWIVDFGSNDELRNFHEIFWSFVWVNTDKIGVQSAVKVLEDLVTEALSDGGREREFLYWREWKEDLLPISQDHQTMKQSVAKERASTVVEIEFSYPKKLTSYLQGHHIDPAWLGRSGVHAR